MYILRTRFKKDIVTEFLPPASFWRRGKGRKYKDKTIILCDGLPTVPSKKALIEFLSKKGYWVFHPRYRGTWESSGRFLRRSPHEDVLDVIAALHRPFRDHWSNAEFHIQPAALYVVGSSFGGAAAIFASLDRRVTKAVAISPVVDWAAKGKVEPMEWLNKFMRISFGEAYRYADRDWKKLEKGGFYNPANHADEVTGKKLLIIHARDDDVVAWKPTARFAKKVGCEFLLLKKGGHLGASILTKPRFYRKMMAFFKKAI